MVSHVKCDTAQTSVRRSPLRALLVAPFLYVSLLTPTGLPADVLVSSALLADSRLDARSDCVADCWCPLWLRGCLLFSHKEVGREVNDVIDVY